MGLSQALFPSPRVEPATGWQHSLQPGKELTAAVAAQRSSRSSAGSSFYKVHLCLLLLLAPKQEQNSRRII